MYIAYVHCVVHKQLGLKLTIRFKFLRFEELGMLYTGDNVIKNEVIALLF